jgi:hypothetical protein
MGVEQGRFSPSALEFFSAPQGLNPPSAKGSIVLETVVRYVRLFK